MADVGIKIRATDEASGVFGKVAAEAGKLQGAVSNVGSSFAALGTAAIAGMSVISFAGQIKQTIDLADSFNKLSQKTGIAVEDFSKLNYAASLADVSTETLAAGMRKLNLSIADAAGGNKEKAALFNALGVSFKDAAGQALSADKVFSSLSDALAKSADGAEKIAVGSDLMGKGFEGLVPLVNTGAKGLADMGDEAKNSASSWAQTSPKTPKSSTTTCAASTWQGRASLSPWRAIWSRAWVTLPERWRRPPSMAANLLA